MGALDKSLSTRSKQIESRIFINKYKCLNEPLKEFLASPQSKRDISVRDILRGTDDALIEGTLLCMNCNGIFEVRKGITILISGRTRASKKRNS